MTEVLVVLGHGWHFAHFSSVVRAYLDLVWMLMRRFRPTT